MSWRRALLLSSAVLPAVGAWLAARSTADTAASRLATGALAAAGFVEWFGTPSPRARELEAPMPDTSGGPGAIDAEPAGSAAGERPRPPQRGKAADAPAPRRGIMVRRSAVASAVRNGVRPSAGAVAATTDHPAGLVVNGWGAAGTGLRDGDIIVSVGGRTPSSVDDVIAAVAGAYRHKVYAVSGRIWRGGETIDVSVELPLPRAEALAPDDDVPLSQNGQRTPKSTGAP